jgi:cytidyltransferase-like protein
MTVNIYTEMVADLFHYGHARFLARARQLGDHLTVGILSDDWCVRHKRAAILTQFERMEVVASCSHVSEVIAVDVPVDGRWLQQHGYAHSVHAYRTPQHRQRDDLRMDPILQGMLVELPYEQKISSSDIIGRVLASQRQNEGS